MVARRKEMNFLIWRPLSYPSPPAVLAVPCRRRRSPCWLWIQPRICVRVEITRRNGTSCKSRTPRAPLRLWRLVAEAIQSHGREREAGLEPVHGVGRGTSMDNAQVRHMWRLLRTSSLPFFDNGSALGHCVVETGTEALQGLWDGSLDQRWRCDLAGRSMLESMVPGARCFGRAIYFHVLKWARAVRSTSRTGSVACIVQRERPI